MIKPYYQDSSCTIYHGDCREIFPQLGQFDAVVTDPPYGIGFAAQPTKGGRSRGQAKETWDDKPVAGLLDIVSIGKIQCVWGGNYYPFSPSRGWLAWYKPDAPPSMSHFELAWTNLDQNARQVSCSIAQTNPERLGHPTQKPLKVMLWTIAQLGIIGGSTIFDPFMGTATTLRAAKDLGFKSVGIERDEYWCEESAKRMQQECLPLVSEPRIEHQQTEMMVNQVDSTRLSEGAVAASGVDAPISMKQIKAKIQSAANSGKS